MRTELLELVKTEIIHSLTACLQVEGITLYIAANDNIPEGSLAVILENIEQTPLYCDKLVTEIRVLLALQGKPSECDALVESLYSCLHPYQLSLPELHVLLMSMHVQPGVALPRRRCHKRAVMRYILEEENA